MKSIRYSIILIITLLLSSLSAEIPDYETYKESLLKFINAPYKRDVETMRKLTTNAEKQAKGGDVDGEERRFLHYVHSLFDALDSSNSKLTDITIKEGHSYEKTENHAFFLINVDYVNNVYGKTFDLSYKYLAVQEPLFPTWKFINASRYGRDRIAQLYPDLPESIKKQIRTELPKKIYNQNHEEIEKKSQPADESDTPTGEEEETVPEEGAPDTEKENIEVKDPESEKPTPDASTAKEDGEE